MPLGLYTFFFCPKGTESLLKEEAKVNEDELKTEEDKKTEVSQALAAVYKRYKTDLPPPS